VAEHEVATLNEEIRDWEPRRALVGGPRGTETINEIVDAAHQWLDADGGVLVCELAPHQSVDRAHRARIAGFADVSVRPDLTGRDRVLVARVSS
jgi:release factor glutamine methyltransferase